MNETLSLICVLICPLPCKYLLLMFSRCNTEWSDEASRLEVNAEMGDLNQRASVVPINIEQILNLSFTNHKTLKLLWISTTHHRKDAKCFYHINLQPRG